MPRMSGRLVRGAALGIVVLGAAGIAWSATGGGSNVVGPRTRIQPTGRQLNPVGELTKLGNFPTGGALTPDGRFLWTLSTGRGINDIRIVAVTGPRAGHASRHGVIPVPPPAGSPPYQTFPPQKTDTLSWPRDVAVSPNGRTVLAALNLVDRAAVIDTRTKRVRYVRVGHYPYGAAITRDGTYGLVTGETQGTVSVINLATA